MPFEGMDPERVRAVALGINAQAETLHRIVGDVESLVAQVAWVWPGPDADDFTFAWSGTHRGQVATVAAGVSEAAALLFRQIEQQLGASDEGGLGSGGGGGWLGAPGGATGSIGRVDMEQWWGTWDDGLGGMSNALGTSDDLMRMGAAFADDAAKWTRAGAVLGAAGIGFTVVGAAASGFANYERHGDTERAVGAGLGRGVGAIGGGLVGGVVGRAAGGALGGLVGALAGPQGALVGAAFGQAAGGVFGSWAGGELGGHVGEAIGESVGDFVGDHREEIDTAVTAARDTARTVADAVTWWD